MPPMRTYIDASNKMKNTDNSFCNPWNVFFPSDWVRSSFKIPEPLRSCKTIDAVTIGPMPRLMRLPNSAPKIIDNVSNLCRALTPKPNSGISPRVKNMMRTIRVHFNFSLKERCFWDGPSTSGRLFKIVFHTDILLFFACAYSKDYLSATAFHLLNGLFGGIRNLYPVLI